MIGLGIEVDAGLRKEEEAILSFRLGCPRE